jgi:hypothetical protein
VGFFEVDADDVLEVIEQWAPGPVFTEQRCREALFSFLTERLSKHGLSKEAPVSHGRADIMVKLKGLGGTEGATVAIEVKYGLTTNNEYKRLIGQMAEYIRDKFELVVVLCGNTKPEFLAGVKEHMKTLAPSGRAFFKGHVIQKAVGERTGKGHFRPGNAKPSNKS